MLALRLMASMGVKDISELYGEIAPGQLLANPSEAWKVAWDVASAGSFNFLYSW
ncbi:hypothetical protein [Yaniella sp.]|uniref:hypothetical protein n=1 Tax=Yaniella sp. TaxID=2773929 RepID=UPI002649A3F8|nr:hypothetical protein [Yaniella sp.]MDN6358593.1 hypothetical protein [Yaniella sp.]